MSKINSKVLFTCLLPGFNALRQRFLLAACTRSGTATVSTVSVWHLLTLIPI